MLVRILNPETYHFSQVTLIPVNSFEAVSYLLFSLCLLAGFYAMFFPVFLLFCHLKTVFLLGSSSC